MLLRTNGNLTSSKVCATAVTLILALTCLLGFTIHAASLTKANPLNQMFMPKASQTPHRTTRTFINGKEVQADGVTAQQNQEGGPRRTKVQWKNDHGSGSLSAEDVELTTDSKDIKAITKDGYFAIDETRDGIRRKLKIEPTSDGKLKRTYSINGVAKEMDEEGKAWLARILHDFLDSSR